MFENIVKLLIVFVSHFLLKSQGLEKLDLQEDNIILVTESFLRNTTNNLFLGLRFKKQMNTKIKQALLVHNFFMSVTLKDHNTLNLIVKLSRVTKQKVNNETERCMDIINEILNEYWNGDDVDSLSNNEGIIEYVDEFLNNLNGFKENISYSDDYVKLDIKDEIIHILKSDNPSKFNSLLNQNTTTTAKYEEDVDFHSDNEFWASQPTRRIYRGDRTKIKYFPFMASIQIFQNFQCAGAIIKSDLIATAASCLQLAWNNRFFRENPAFLSVRVGSNFYNGGGENIPVLEVYFHPDYNPRNLRNNIAILRLRRHLKFRKRTRRIKKIIIDRQDSSLPMTTDGITIVGWGARGSNNIVRDPWSNQLAYAVLDVYHLQECQEIYSREYVTRTNFCAGFVSKGGGACNHDVGGPGVVNGILTGIISFGSPVCGTPDAPTVFTKVGFYADWIEEIMEQDVPITYRKTTLSYPPPPNTPPTVHLAPTDFKMFPLGDKLKPIPFNEADSLRLLEDEELFKEFLTTMFNSEEANEYKQLLNDFPVKNSNELETESVKTPKTKSKKEKYGKLIQQQLESITAGKLGQVVRDKVNKEKHKTSKEIDDQTNPEHEERFYEVATDVGYHTEMGPYDSSDKGKHKSFTMSDTTMIDAEEENDETIEKEIVKLIDNVDLSDTDDKSSASKASKESEQKTKVRVREKEKRVTNAIVEKSTNNFRDGIPMGITKLDIVAEKPLQKTTRWTPHKLKRDDVFTLLYISDNENSNGTFNGIGNAIADFDDNFSEGIPIAADGFSGYSFMNNKTKQKSESVLDFLSRRELYDLLSEAIDEVTKYKKSKKRLIFFRSLKYYLLPFYYSYEILF